MLRRATAAYFFTSAQVETILGEIDAGGYVEAMVLFFSRVLDLEQHHMLDRLQSLLPTEPMRSEYAHRIGPANTFNPLWPDGMYELNLKAPEDRAVAQMLAELSGEPGENWIDETYDEMPFDLGKAWLTAVPDRGHVHLEFRTSPGTASYTMRCALARRHLMPGPNRWQVIPPDRVISKEREADPRSFDDMTDRSDLVLDADGTLKTLRSVFLDCDRDRSGYLGRNEFVAATYRLLGGVSLESIHFVWEAHTKSLHDEQSQGPLAGVCAGQGPLAGASTKTVRDPPFVCVRTCLAG
jgi:hypothetical protein